MSVRCQCDGVVFRLFLPDSKDWLMVVALYMVPKVMEWFRLYTLKTVSKNGSVSTCGGLVS